jgi:SM-20-related protein
MALIEPENQMKYSQIASELRHSGWCVSDNFLSADHVKALADESWALWRSGLFRHARVGTGKARELRPEVRRDDVLWLENNRLTPMQQRYFDEMEQLRLEINRTLFLGLFEFEAHLAVYPTGAYYRRHLDQFRRAKPCPERSRGSRIVSCLLYLNTDWQETDDGQLRLYLSENDNERYVDIFPHGGALVVFLSAQFYHEVLPTKRERLSLTGWFKTRA